MMGRIRSVAVPKLGSSTGQPAAWGELKAKIHQAIKRDEQPQVFEALLADVNNFIAELMQTG